VTTSRSGVKVAVFIAVGVFNITRLRGNNANGWKLVGAGFVHWDVELVHGGIPSCCCNAFFKGHIFVRVASGKRHVALGKRNDFLAGTDNLVDNNAVADKIQLTYFASLPERNQKR
jgi:hypothetical protein